jgi:hypothetical protein
MPLGRLLRKSWPSSTSSGSACTTAASIPGNPGWTTFSRNVLSDAKRGNLQPGMEKPSWRQRMGPVEAQPKELGYPTHLYPWPWGISS